jgi:hypothetical protein
MATNTEELQLPAKVQALKGMAKELLRAIAEIEGALSSAPSSSLPPPASPSVASIMKSPGVRRTIPHRAPPSKEEEENEEGFPFIVFNEDLVGEWSARGDDAFLLMFSTDLIDSIDKQDVEQILYVAQAKNLFLSMEHDVLDRANRKAWPEKKNHYKNKMPIVRQIKQRLKQDYEAIALGASE